MKRMAVANRRGQHSPPPPPQSQSPKMNIDTLHSHNHTNNTNNNNKHDDNTTNKLDVISKESIVGAKKLSEYFVKMAKKHKVFNNGKVTNIGAGRALSDRSPSSAGGDGDCQKPVTMVY